MFKDQISTLQQQIEEFDAAKIQEGEGKKEGEMINEIENLKN